MSCCSLHPYLPLLTKRSKPVGWDGHRPLAYQEEHWGVTLRGRQVIGGVFADRVSAQNYIDLLQHEVHGTDPGIIGGELVIDGLD